MDMMEKEMPGEEKEEKSEYGKYQEYEIKSAVRCLQEAEEIKADPEKMKYVKMCMKEDLAGLKKSLKSISSLDDVRQARQELPDKDTENES